jgi:hypothetical protein
MGPESHGKLKNPAPEALVHQWGIEIKGLKQGRGGDRTVVIANLLIQECNSHALWLRLAAIPTRFIPSRFGVKHEQRAVTATQKKESSPRKEPPEISRVRAQDLYLVIPIPTALVIDVRA